MNNILRKMEEAILNKLKVQRPYLEDLLKRRFFLSPAFSIYGGITGLFDLGPPACSLKQEILTAWRNHFILEESMLEVACSNLNPYIALKASGHVDKFCDWMVKDVVTGECQRADKLIEEWCNVQLQAKDCKFDKNEIIKLQSLVGGYKDVEIKKAIEQFQIKYPGTENALSDPFEFNLMFATKMGPKQDRECFLRPETAQGIFVNFRKLLQYNGGRLPFAAATIGTGFRNEISPRDVLLRLREFDMAEIEHFVHSDQKDQHPKFPLIASLQVILLPNTNQEQQKGSVIMTFEEAINQKIINNKTLAYFMARTWLFLQKLGIQKEGIRFRQHMSNEMAHYANDCWDAEILLSYGWIECVGIADRGCFDLEKHMEASKVDLLASQLLPQPKIVNELEYTLNKAACGKLFKKEMSKVQQFFESLTLEDKQKYSNTLQESGKLSIEIQNQVFEFTPDLVNFKMVEKKIHEEKFLPNVVEPSFGISRILYATLEHNFDSRDPLQQTTKAKGFESIRTFFSFPPLVSPTKCSILPLMSQQIMTKYIDEIRQSLVIHNISYVVDESGVSIGKRYARTDELGIPFAITIDHQTDQDRTVTLRQLLSMDQIRVTIQELGSVISSMIHGVQDWQQVSSTHVKAKTQEEESKQNPQ